MYEFMKETFVIKELGFKEGEMEAIENHFSCTLNLDDWESIEIIEEEEEESENFFKLPTGRMVYFPDDLLHKEILAQID